MAFLVSVGLFAYFWIVGFAALGLLYRRDDRIRTALIAPAVGIEIVLCGTYAWSRLGFAIGVAGLPWALGLVAVAVVALLTRRPPLPGRRGLPYLALAIAAFAASGWPLLTDGFDWFAGLNPDAANYMLYAARLVHEPYIAVPDAQTWLSQSDWSRYAVMLPLSGARTGSELLLAWVVSVTHLDEVAAYMPLIVTLHVALLGAAGGLIGTGHRFARLLSTALLAVCALSSLGVTLQLLAQELGLTGLVLNAVLLMSPFYRLARYALARFVPLAAVAAAGLTLSYPELLPFLGIGCLVYHGSRHAELRRHWRPALGAAAAMAALAVLLIAPDILGLLDFLLAQANAGAAKQAYPELFPYFLIPTGIAALWGLRTYAPGEPSLLPDDPLVVLGIILSLAGILATGWMLRRREPSAAVLAGMLALAVALIWDESGFGVFKLAMYAQPFLVTTVVLSLCRLLRVAR